MATLKLLIVNLLAITYYIQIDEASFRSQSRLPSLDTQYQVEPVGDVIFIEGRQKIAPGTNETVIKIDAGLPCDDLDERLRKELKRDSENERFSKAEIARYIEKLPSRAERC